MTSKPRESRQELRTLQEELARSRAALQTLIDHAPFGAQRYQLAEDGRLVLLSANEVAAQILGSSQALSEGLPMEKAFTALAATSVPARCREVAQAGGLFEDNRVTCTSNGVSTVFEIHALQPAPAQVVVLFRDITEQIHMQEALGEQEKRLASIFRAAPVGIGMAINRVILEANERLCQMTGYSRKELLGSSTQIFYTEQAEFLRVGKELGTEEQLTGFGATETRWRRKDGTTIDVLLGTSPLVPGDFSAGVTFTVLDVTERRRAEADRQELEARMLQAQKLESLGVLAGGIAHDFNNILMTVLGNADLAQLHPGIPSSVREHIVEIEKAARRAAVLCRQMLDFAGKGSFMTQPLRINDIIGDMENALHVSVPKKATLRLALGQDLPSVAADAAQIRQVIMTLVINASEAIGEKDGVITITTGVRHCDRASLRGASLSEEPIERRYVFIEVSDNGAGMDAVTQARIFEPFFTTKFTGRGLGLPAVQGIVRGHKGVIKVSSAVGKGSTFTVLLPAEGQEDPLQRDAPANDDAAPGSARSQPH